MVPPKTSSRRLLLSVLGRATDPSGVSRKVAAAVRKAAALAVFALLLAAVGCGGEEGIAEGATVTVYAGAPLCAGAKSELARAGERTGSVRVAVLCAAPVEATGGTDGKAKLDLAAAGANARRAVEDSRTVAYLEAPGRAVRFTRPILEEANIGMLVTGTGGAGDGQGPRRDRRRRRLGRPSRSGPRRPRKPLEKVGQRLVEVGVAELVAEVGGPPRHDPLAAPEHGAELAAVHQVEGEARHRHRRRPAQGAAERPGELRGW